MYEAQFGTQLGVVGNVPELGGPGWSPDACLTLEWSDGHVWSGVVELSTTHAIEFKVRRLYDALAVGTDPARAAQQG